MRYFSPSTKGFYGLEHQENKPNDCVEITDEDYKRAQSYDAVLYQLSSDINGKPILVDKIDDRTYNQKRQQEYPSIADQLDTLYHKGYDGWKAEIEAVKNKYPKGAT
jgi:hypothetical protein